MDPRYPIGKFQRPSSIDAETVSAAITAIAEMPGKLKEAVTGLSPAQLDTPYREGGWTVRQVIHHVPESHLNAYTRTKLALTEDNPVIKPYDEDAWAKLPDVPIAPVGVSLLLLDTLHARWVTLLRTLGPEQWGRTFQHPESGVWRLDQLACLYAWHGAHHTAHVTTLRQTQGW
jgi:hypothetical protein